MIEIGLTFDDTYVGFGPIIGTVDISRSMPNSSGAQMTVESSELH